MHNKVTGKNSYEVKHRLFLKSDAFLSCSFFFLKITTLQTFLCIFLKKKTQLIQNFSTDGFVKPTMSNINMVDSLRKNSCARPW